MSEPRFIMTWRERGGPSVSAPQQKGFGHTAMIWMVEHAFDADVALNYDPEGVTWNMNAPLKPLRFLTEEQAREG